MMQMMQSAIKKFNFFNYKMANGGNFEKKNIKVPSAQLFGQKLQFLY